MPAGSFQFHFADRVVKREHLVHSLRCGQSGFVPATNGHRDFVQQNDHRRCGPSKELVEPPSEVMRRSHTSRSQVVISPYIVSRPRLGNAAGGSRLRLEAVPRRPSGRRLPSPYGTQQYSRRMGALPIPNRGQPVT
jgi:hypothetical protein